MAQPRGGGREPGGRTRRPGAILRKELKLWEANEGTYRAPSVGHCLYQVVLAKQDSDCRSTERARISARL